MHKSAKLSASFGSGRGTPMRLKLTTVCLTATLLAGCVGSATQSVKSFIPGQLSADQPVLAQLDKTYSARAGAIGAQQDRYHNQSVGLGLVSHPEAERYINQQLEKLKQASGIQGLPGQAYLFADTAYGTRNSADGNIYIPYVMLRDIDSTDELAALLARELAHTVRNHNNSDLFGQLQKKGMMAAEMFSSFKGSDGQRRPEQERMEDILNAISIADGFINPGWSGRQDQEADRLGMDLLIAAGYNSNAMLTLLGKMDGWEVHNKQELSLRTSGIEQMLMANGIALADLPFADSINSLFDHSVSQLGTMFSKLNLDQGSAEKRQEGLRTYLGAHYAAARSPALETRNWRRVSRTQKSERITQSLKQVVQARDAAAQGDLGNAEKLLRAAVNPHTNHQNFLRQSFHELRAAQGNRQGMQQNIALAMRGEYPSLQVHVGQAQLTGESNPASARRLISTFDQYGKPPAYYLPVVTMAEKSQLSAEALRLQAECAAKHFGQGVACSTAGGAGGGAGIVGASYNSLLNALTPTK